MERYTPSKKELALAVEKAGDHCKKWGGPPDMLAAYITAFIAGIEYSKAEQLSPSPVEVDGSDEDLAAEIVARFSIVQGRGGSVTKLRKEAFVDGALWMRGRRPASSGETMRFVRASERLPEPNKPESLKGKVKRDIITKLVYSDSSVNGYDQDTMYVEGRNDDIYIPFDRLEWLDESPSDTKEEAINDAMIDAVYEGAEFWKQEYDDCRRILTELVELKAIKTLEGKTQEYERRQPMAWQDAIEFLSEYQHL
jgi:hypothetical protein